MIGRDGGISAGIIPGLAQLDTDFQELIRSINRLIIQTSLGVVVPISQGGTSATTAPAALANLGVGSAGTRAASNPADPNVASVLFPITVGHLAVFADTQGTVQDGGPIPGGVVTAGTWTPALQFGGASTGITYSSQLGTYTAISREVICRFRMVLTSVGSSTGVATIAGLPFTSNIDATNYGSGGLVSAYSGMASISATPTIEIGPGSTIVSLLSAGATSTAALTNSNFTNTTVINGAFGYFI